MATSLNQIAARRRITETQHRRRINLAAMFILSGRS